VDAPIILVAGIPASGKSTYGQWLDKEKGFLHLDVEQDEVLDRAGLRSSWEAISSPFSAAPFITDLKKLGKPVVINWGFPPICLNVVAALKAVHISLWWFDGNRAAAREAFIQRGTVPPECFKRQMDSIEKAWPNINQLFDSRIIMTISIGPRFVASDEIFARMFPRA
jgi:hypothetical protein